MSTVRADSGVSFAIWITGLPASGKSAITSRLTELLEKLGTALAVLESDALRARFTDRPAYDEHGREYFYGAITLIAEVLTSRGVSVIIDATANRRAYRERARKAIGQFMEVFVACPLEVCVARDPKGLYRKALQDPGNQMPGLGAPYEHPECPDVIIHSEYETPAGAAERIVEALVERGFLARA
ncbi:MAG TPA: adenylyl-sulfate kinase [Terriglobia bacterium]|nr:adenylyl-sulfate kinase [Terriglobia bacterium]